MRTTDKSRAGPPEPADVPTGELENAIAEQAAHVDAGICRLLQLIGERKRRGGWWGDVTFAHFLAWWAGLSPARAREYERVAERLTELPCIREAFSRGQLPYAKVKALAAVATGDCEERLLRLARDMTASQLERSISAYRRYSLKDAKEQQEREFLRYSWDEDGSLSLRARLQAPDGALLLRALDASREALWKRQREKREAAAPEGVGGEPETVEKSRGAGAASRGKEVAESAASHHSWQPPPRGSRVTNTDAFVGMCDLALSKPEGERAGERTQVIVHVDARTLVDDEEGSCHLEDGPAISPETARRLACDATLATSLCREGKVLSLGRKRRTISPALRRALKQRDTTCRFPGCDKTGYLQGHHVRHWADGGETNPDNLLLLCRTHHGFVHEGGYTVDMEGDGKARWRSPCGSSLPTAPRSPPTHPGALHEQNADRGLHIDEKTCWRGLHERMDASMAVEAVGNIVERPQDEAARGASRGTARTPAGALPRGAIRGLPGGGRSE